MADHNLQWRPGTWGKGYVEPDGSVISWPTESQWGGPHHAEKATGDISDTPRVQRDMSGFTISPEGVFDFSFMHGKNDEQIGQQIAAADPRMQYGRWHFGNAQHPDAQWQPGTWGKGLLMNDGSLHSWNVQPDLEAEHSERDGSPGHYEYYTHHFYPDADINDPSTFNHIAEDLDYSVDTGFWISPEGIATHPGRDTHPGLEQALAEAHPNAKMDYAGWQLASVSTPFKTQYLHESVRAPMYKSSFTDGAPFSQELRLWLEQVDDATRAETGPTPHHDHPGQLAQQPGLIARVKNALKPEPKKFIKHEDPEVPEDEWEQQKQDWAENDDGWGWPTRFPWQEEPWRTHARMTQDDRDTSGDVRDGSNPRPTPATNPTRVSQVQGSVRDVGSHRREHGVRVRGQGVRRPDQEHHSFQSSPPRGAHLKTAEISQPNVVWHGVPPFEMEGDHSFLYVPEGETGGPAVHIGTPELHHEDLANAGIHRDISPSGWDEQRFPQGSVYDQNVNMDTRVPVEVRNSIAKALGLPEMEDWSFDPDYWKAQ